MARKKTISFSKGESYEPRNARESLLADAFAALKNPKEAAEFLRDLMTPAEIEEFSNRLEIARMLMRGAPYLKIANDTGTSTTTVTRVAHWLFNGCGGYYSVLRRLINRNRR